MCGGGVGGEEEEERERENGDDDEEEKECGNGEWGIVVVLWNWRHCVCCNVSVLLCFLCFSMSAFQV